VVHLTWKTETLPWQWRDTLTNWQGLHPTWHVQLWTDALLDQFVEQEYPLRRAQFKSYKQNIMRVDMSRYLLLERFGGLYMDLDIEPLYSFDPLLEFYEKLKARVLLCESATVHANQQNLTNAILMSTKGHEFWGYVKEILENPYLHGPWWKKIVGPASHHFTVIFETGPGVINEAFRIYRRNTLEYENDLRVIPRQLLQFSPHWEKRPATSADGLVRILSGGSWHNWESRMWTHADRFWARRDTWGVVLAAIFLVTILLQLLL
jgi:mannosyltransferase OCH1-like enzyme